MKPASKINSIFFIIGFIFPYIIYGQNKILSPNSEKWQKIETEFIILYYPENYGFLALKTVAIAKRAISYYSKILNHKLTHQIIIFIYPSFRDFQSSYLHPFLLPEGIAGYTEPYLERVVLPYNGDEKEFHHTLTHELVHSFQFDIMLNLGRGRKWIPSWLVEGMAEYFSIGILGNMEEYIRDLVISKRLPDIYALSDNGYANYKVGQSVMYFIHKNWSLQHIGLLFRNLLITQDLEKSFFYTFQMNFFDFNLRWKDFIYQHYKDEPAHSYEFRNRITFRYDEILRGESPFHFKPSVSPDGKYIAYITYRTLYPSLVIQKVPSPYLNRKQIQKRKYILDFLKDENFEEWQPLTTKINFDSSGRYLLIPTRRKSQLSIIQFDIHKRKIQNVYPLPFDSIFEPFVSHSDENQNSTKNEKIVFTATLRGFSDVYILDLNQRSLKKITSDFNREISPIFGLDNRYVLFIKRNQGMYELHRVDLQDLSDHIIFKTHIPIFSLREGYYYIQDRWEKGIFYIGQYRRKKTLYFFSKNKHYVVSKNNRDIFSFDVYTKILKNSQNDQEISSILFYTTLEEGVYEIFYQDFSKQKKEFYQFYGFQDIEIKDFQEISFLDKEVLKPSFCCSNYPETIRLKNSFRPYKPHWYMSNHPFVILTGSVDNEGNTGLVFLGWGSLADVQNKHQIDAFVSYQNKPALTNGEIRYRYRLNRTQWNTGVYSYNGVFVIFNPLDISLNNIIYNPFRRLLSNSISGIYGNFQYYLHNYSSLGLQLDVGREEQIYLPPLPEERPNQDVFKNHFTLRGFYLHNNAKYSLFGPLDGYSFLLGYEIPLKTNQYDKQVYQTILEYRYYNLFSDYSLFAYRLVLASQTGKDAMNFPYRIGGYDTIRGYEFQKFEGRYAFIMNIEYRFTFIEQLLFGFPFRWSPGLIRGSFFMDMGAAFDNLKTFQAFDGKRKITRDLKASIGVGIQWYNFLWFIFPGAVMKIEWASPYNGKKSLPFSKWQGRFSLGFVF